MQMPDLVVDYNMSTHEFSVVHQEEVLCATDGAYTDSSNLVSDDKLLSKIRNDNCKLEVRQLQNWKEFSSKYACVRHQIISHDGTEIPLTVVFSRYAHHKGQSPGILEAYGAYGEVLDKSWSSDRLSLLDRGWVVAFADVR